MVKPRMPGVVREKLAGALKRITDGPGCPMTDPTQGVEFNAGLAAGMKRHAGWRASWVEHELDLLMSQWKPDMSDAQTVSILSQGAS